MEGKGQNRNSCNSAREAKKLSRIGDVFGICMLAACITIASFGLMACSAPEPDPNNDLDNMGTWEAPKKALVPLRVSPESIQNQTRGMRAMRSEEDEPTIDPDDGKVPYTARVSICGLSSDPSLKWPEIDLGECEVYKPGRFYEVIQEGDKIETIFNSVYVIIYKGTEKEDTISFYLNQGGFDTGRSIEESANGKPSLPGYYGQGCYYEIFAPFNEDIDKQMQEEYAAIFAPKEGEYKKIGGEWDPNGIEIAGRVFEMNDEIKAIIEAGDSAGLVNYFGENFFTPPIETQNPVPIIEKMFSAYTIDAEVPTESMVTKFLPALDPPDPSIEGSEYTAKFSILNVCPGGLKNRIIITEDGKNGIAINDYSSNLYCK